jgi:hypothetical protein
MILTQEDIIELKEYIELLLEAETANLTYNDDRLRENK